MLRVAHGKLVTHGGNQSSVGVLEIPTLAELRSQASMGGQVSTMDIVIRRRTQTACEPESRGTLFQVASKSNLLEMVSQHVTPEHGVARYEGDPTQGPACAIAVSAGTIYRTTSFRFAAGPDRCPNCQIDCLADLALP